MWSNNTNVSSLEHHSNVAPLEKSKPRVKLIAGGARVLGQKSRQGTSTSKPQDAAFEKPRHHKIVDDKSQTKRNSRGDSPTAEMMMKHLHASYGSLNNSSSSNLNLSLSNFHDALEDEGKFDSPLQTSHWKVKLKQTPVNIKQKIAPPSVCESPRLKPVSPLHEKRQCGGDWTDPDANMLLEDFSTPRQSPWRSKAATKRHIHAVPSRPPSFSPEEEIARREEEASESTIATEVSDVSKPEVKRARKKKKDKRETSKVPRETQKETGHSTAMHIESVNAQRNLAVSTLSSQQTKQKSKKRASTVQYVAKQPREFGRNHHRAATLINAGARGRIGRLKAHLRLLECRLENMDYETERDIERIRSDTAAAQKDFNKRAKERHANNFARKGGNDDKVKGNQDIIAKLREENAKVRSQNKQLYQDVQALKINNKRLEETKIQGSDCYDRLEYHDETCVTENVKLTAIAKKYEDAIAELTERLDLHNSYADAEHRIKGLYRKLRRRVLEKMDGIGNVILRDDVYAMASSLDEELRAKQEDADLLGDM